jgi:predicted nucleotidyltransferase component of viral defense system
MAIHKVYDFTMPTLPVVAQEEAIAEKLARFRRVPLARDLYDLTWYASQPFDEPLVRRLWVLKTYRDIVRDGRGDRPIDPGQVLRHWVPANFRSEDIGYLVGVTDIRGWLATVHRRFAFLCGLDEDEVRWCQGNPRDAYEVLQALSTRCVDRSDAGVRAERGERHPGECGH